MVSNTVLHTLNAGPSSSALTDCLRLLAPGSALLLTGDGAYCARAGTEACQALLGSGAELYVLAEHAAARGVAPTAEGISAIDMDAFVALTEQYPRQLAWY